MIVENINELKKTKDLKKTLKKIKLDCSKESEQDLIIDILFLKYIWNLFQNSKEKLKKLGFKISEKEFNLFFQKKFNLFHKNVNNIKFDEIIDEAFLKLKKFNKSLNIFDFKNYTKEKDIKKQEFEKVINFFNKFDFFKKSENKEKIQTIFLRFLKIFFLESYKKGEEYITPLSISKLMVELLEVKNGTIFDPACGIGGILIECNNYKNNINDTVLFGQEKKTRVWKWAKFNFFLNEISLITNNGKQVLGQKSGDIFNNDQHKNLKFDFIMTDLPFDNKKDDENSSITYVEWIDLIISKLKKKGKAIILFSNNINSSTNKRYKMIRKDILEKNKLDAIFILPKKIFYKSSVSACLWILNNNKNNKKVLIMDISEFVEMNIDKKVEFSKKNIEKIVRFYKNYSLQNEIKKEDFYKIIHKDEFEENEYSFLVGKYLSVSPEKIDIEKEKEKIKENYSEYEELLLKLNESSSKLKKNIQNITKKNND